MPAHVLLQDRGVDGVCAAGSPAVHDLLTGNLPTAHQHRQYGRHRHLVPHRVEGPARKLHEALPASLGDVHQVHPAIAELVAGPVKGRIHVRRDRTVHRGEASCPVPRAREEPAAASVRILHQRLPLLALVRDDALVAAPPGQPGPKPPDLPQVQGVLGEEAGVDPEVEVQVEHAVWAVPPPAPRPPLQLSGRVVQHEGERRHDVAQAVHVLPPCAREGVGGVARRVDVPHVPEVALVTQEEVRTVAPHMAQHEEHAAQVGALRLAHVGALKLAPAGPQGHGLRVHSPVLAPACPRRQPLNGWLCQECRTRPAGFQTPRPAPWCASAPSEGARL
mmetsp:Transcript_46678/g.141629  ORF Transcript_46678/g.141629 Transcript_46678/m.141629 type:complete len:334 (-) Transcript_46678:88-1089(-)